MQQHPTHGLLVTKMIEFTRHGKVVRMLTLDPTDKVCRHTPGPRISTIMQECQHVCAGHGYEVIRG